jgi:putative transcriptional regulator
MSMIAIQLGLLRTARQLSQRELARRTNLRPDTISALERGQTTGIDFATLAKLCDALHCTPNDLLELAPDAHVVPVLGGPDEDAIIAERLARADWSVVDDPASAAAVLPTGQGELTSSTAQAVTAHIGQIVRNSMVHAVRDTLAQLQQESDAAPSVTVPAMYRAPLRRE